MNIILLILILIVAAIPRAVEIIGGNFLWGFDQGLFFEAVRKIVVDHKLTLIGAEVGGAGGFFQGPGWYYLLSIPFFISGGDPYASMILMFLIGIATVFVGLILGTKMVGIRTGLFIAFFIAVSPAIVAQSRFIWPPFPISLITVFYLFFLFKVFQKKEIFFPLVTFTAGLMAHFEIATAGFVVSQLTLLAIILLMKRIISFRVSIISIFTFLLCMFPLILFNIRHNNIIVNGVLNVFMHSNATGNKITTFNIYQNHVNTFLHSFQSTFQPDIIHVPLLLVLVIGACGILFNKDYSKSVKAFVGYLIISPFIFFLMSLLYLKPMWPWWILHLSIYYCFLTGIVFAYLWKEIIFRVIIIILITLMSGDYADKTMLYYRHDLHDYGGTHKIKGKVDAVDYVYSDAKGKEFGVLVFSPPVYTYDVDYLLWWRGEREYNYKPHREKRGLVYLIIEPDPEKPWSYKGWLETVIKTGKVLETKTLPSGMIIQKRFMESNEK